MTTETVYHPKSSSKIPPFDEKNLSMWKTKAFYVLEAMDEHMLDIVNEGQKTHVPTNEGSYC